MGKRQGNISDLNSNVFAAQSATHDVLLPSNKVIKIRERNGEDEDVLSKNRDFKDGMAIPKFLSRIIVSEPITPQQILKWKIRDKYYLLFKERLASWGAEMVFSHTFQDGETHEFTEDLDHFDWDFSKGAPPVKGEEDYDEQRIIGYPAGEEGFEGTTSSGKKYKMEYLTGDGELKTLGKELDDLVLSDKMRIRNFQLQDDKGIWHRIERFSMLTAKDTAEIRNHIVKMDPDFNLMVDIKHPHKNITETISLLSIPDFFFPKA